MTGLAAVRLFHRLIVRHAVRHWFVLLLNILSLALGVGIYLAVSLAGAAADRAFRATIDSVSGRSHLEAHSPAGRLPEAVWPLLAGAPDVAAATPLVEGFLTLPDFPGEYLHVIGIDLFTQAPFRTWSPAPAADGEAGSIPTDELRTSGGLDLEAFLAQPAALAIPDALARATGLGRGDRFRAQVDGTVRELEVLDVVRFDDAGTGGADRIALMDIGWAQELFSVHGYLTSVQILVRDLASIGAAADRLAGLLPEDVRISTPERRGERIQTMIQGFQLNIRALGMVSILVGVFLIYSTVSASVVRRRSEIGTLRSVGASPLQIRALFLLEAAFSGTVGILTGIPLGLAAAGSLVGTIADTISVHYVLLSVGTPAVDPGEILAAVVYGGLATLAGAWIPASEASRCDPVAALSPGRLFEMHTQTRPRSIRAGAAALVGCGLLCVVSLVSGPAWLSFPACLLLVAGFSSFVPAASAAWARVAGSAARSVRTRTRRLALLVSLATENFARSLHRSTATIAAMMCAIAMVIGVSVMVSSFRRTVSEWITSTMIADLYVAPAANEVLGLRAFLPTTLRAEIAASPDVRDTSTHLAYPILMIDGTETTLDVVDDPRPGTIAFVDGIDGEEAMRAFLSRRNAVLASEPLANRLGVKAGDTVQLISREGPAPFTIVGVYRDYSDDSGRLMMRRPVFDRSWHEPRYHSIAVHLAPDAEASALAGSLRRRLADTGEVLVLSNRDLREQVLRIFDQTFAVTYVLRTIAIVVAVLGIVLSLTTLAAERVRETAVLRSIGASRSQIGGLFLVESGTIGAVSSALGLGSGILLAMILTWVVNKAFFGWTVQFHLPLAELAWTPVWVTATAVLSGILPAVRAGQAPLGATLHGDA